MSKSKATYTDRRNGLGFDDLPYRVEYGHWGMTASCGDPRHPCILATVNFPVGSRGPHDPPNVRDSVFTQLDALARAALGRPDLA